ncbi:FkbM family methyltransferase [Thalassovita aquimarina]|uniref:FkbM family methyltransferase n=2 Tax=Thalassovita aquimarina TaxID=2785917 RepID=A0ABS5HQ12_9RHOB|nr:FkbM family methyltransferase [Thalassovita aquimarina]MBR9650902.1 FkbM family methyltransferase [Thalassovita aquimarina]
MDRQQQKHLRKAFQVAGPKVRRHLRPLLPQTAVSFAGVELLVNPRDNFTEQCIWLNGEPPEAQSLQALTDIVRGKRALVLDIGGNCGAFAVPLARAAGAGSRVIAFEPNPVMLGRLGENVRRNGLGDVVRIEGCALGAEEGEAKLMLSAGNYGQASLRGVGKGKADGTVCVPVRPLAPYMKGADDYDVCVIKIDVEGFEDSVLGPWLDQAGEADMPDAILIETEHAAEWGGDLIGRITSAGYAPRFEGEGNTLFVRDAGRLSD